MWLWRKRLVRLHLEGSQPSIEGILTGFWANHYVLATATVLETPERSYELDGLSVRVPRERVVMVQELKS